MQRTEIIMSKRINLPKRRTISVNRARKNIVIPTVSVKHTSGRKFRYLIAAYYLEHVESFKQNNNASIYLKIKSLITLNRERHFNV